MTKPLYEIGYAYNTSPLADKYNGGRGFYYTRENRKTKPVIHGTIFLAMEYLDKIGADLPPSQKEWANRLMLATKEVSNA